MTALGGGSAGFEPASGRERGTSSTGGCHRAFEFREAPAPGTYPPLVALAALHRDLVRENTGERHMGKSPMERGDIGGA
jgi:hypothetical protein